LLGYKSRAILNARNSRVKRFPHVTTSQRLPRQMASVFAETALPVALRAAKPFVQELRP
jgi:hypothetical protein